MNAKQLLYRYVSGWVCSTIDTVNSCYSLFTWTNPLVAVRGEKQTTYSHYWPLLGQHGKCAMHEEMEAVKSQHCRLSAVDTRILEKLAAYLLTYTTMPY